MCENIKFLKLYMVVCTENFCGEQRHKAICGEKYGARFAR